MPISKINSFPFFALPFELRAGAYDQCDKKTLARLARTCKQADEEINPRVEVKKRNRSPFDTHRKRDFPGIVVPKEVRLYSAKAVYRVAEIVFTADERMEFLKWLASVHCQQAIRHRAYGFNERAQESESAAQHTDEKVRILSEKLKKLCESKEKLTDHDIDGLLDGLLRDLNIFDGGWTHF